MSRGWPRMPIGRSSSVTERAPRYRLIAWRRDPSRSAPDAQWREGGSRPAGRHDCCRGAWGRDAVGVPGRHECHQRPERSHRLAQLGPPPRDSECSWESSWESQHLVGEAAVVAVAHRLLRKSDNLPSRCRSHRTRFARPAWHPSPPRARAVLRLTGAQPTPALHAGQRARRPLPGSPDRYYRALCSALPSPSSLVIVVGCSAQQLSKVPGAAQITSINTNASIGGIAGGFHTKQLETILAVGALALLLPVLVFIGTAARLAAARREQRFAAMRLAGATPRQIGVISTVEASIAALWGVAIGFCLFYGIRPALTDVAFTGQRFAPGDLSLGLIDVVVVAIGIPAAAAVSARFAMRRAQISPLGVTRRVTPPAPRAYRLAPLVAGRRLADNPSGAFRTISGLIIALFAASASVGVLTTILAYGGTANGGTVASETLLEELGHVVSIGVNGHRPPATATTTTKTAVPPALLGELTSIPGVRGATVVYSEPGAGQGSSAGLLLCSQLARTRRSGPVPPGPTSAGSRGSTPSHPGSTPP